MTRTVETRSAVDFLPAGRASLRTLAEAAMGCQGCELYRNATQTVFGEGPRNADVMLVGEQPGDREDREGRPFVGPAGELLDRGLEEAGIDCADVYVNNRGKALQNGPRRHAASVGSTGSPTWTRLRPAAPGWRRSSTS
jgi:DNA polymerase